MGQHLRWYFVQELGGIYQYIMEAWVRISWLCNGGYCVVWLEGYPALRLEGVCWMRVKPRGCQLVGAMAGGRDCMY
jgi:hypothetical protein